MRSLVAGTVGRADEIVVRPRRDARRIGFDNVQSVANGTFLTGTLQPFAQSEADAAHRRRSPTTTGSPGSRRPSVEQVTAVNTVDRRAPGPGAGVRAATRVPAGFRQR